ncbi:MAG TPA: caspase family protein [Xanthobacteraceae bacterium]|nr:caspase family protein [Xanthobacteraceae bacterium]
MRRCASLVVVAILFLSVAATAARADNRVALVIGNGAYVHVPHLPNPTHDAEDVAAALRRTGFETILGTDLDQAGMQNAAIRFARAARSADVAVFYYSGHAMQYAGVNYLVPIDAELHDEADLRRMARVDDILADLQQARNLRILVLDSCRDNPLADELKRSVGSTRGVSIGRGLAKIESPDGTIIAYSTQAGRTAEDGSERNSPYTAAFLQHIEDKDDVATVFHRIGANVYQTTQGKQVPELSISFFGEFYLNGKLQVTVAPAAPSAPADPCAAAESHWKSAEAIGTIDAYRDHLARFPNCTFAELAKARIESLNKKMAIVAPPPTAVVPPDGAALRTGLVGYWPLDAGSTNMATNTAQDLSGNNNAGVLVRLSATASPRAGKVGGALRFDGTNYVQTSFAGVSGRSARTISLWLKTAQTSPLPGKNTSTVLAYGDARRCANPGYFVVATNDRFGSSTNHRGITIDFPCHAAVTYDAAIYDDRWHHVVIAMPNEGTTSSIKVYVDGVLLNTISALGEGSLDTGSGTNVLIGYDAYFNHAGNTNGGFQGAISDVRFYNRALSAPEVAQLYSTGN